jgi:nucleoid-associated protein EbfC
MNPLEMMRQAQQLQQRMQQEMSTIRVEGAAGGGMVTVVVNGHKQLQSLKIDPESVSKDDVEMLQDLIVAAVNDALRKASGCRDFREPPGITAEPHRSVQAAARRGGQERAAPRIPRAQDAARRCRAVVRGDS